MKNIGEFIYLEDLEKEQWDACSSRFWSEHKLGDKASFEVVLKKLQSEEKFNWLLWLMSRKVDWADGFLKIGVSVNMQDNNNQSPLHLASFYGRVAVVSFLLVNGALVNQQDDDNWSALHWAACNGRVAVISFLLVNGADATLKTTNRDTPLDIARYNGYIDVVRLFEEHLKKINLWKILLLFIKKSV
jgi:hypothetical protein